MPALRSHLRPGLYRAAVGAVLRRDHRRRPAGPALVLRLARVWQRAAVYRAAAEQACQKDHRRQPAGPALVFRLARVWPRAALYRAVVG